MSSTVADLLSAGRQGTFCLGSTDESPQSFADMAASAALIGGMVRPSSRHARPVVAILLPQGPLLAATLVGVMCHGAAAPLNPRLSASEITYVLNDLQADMLLTVPGFHPDGEAAARELDIAVVDCTDTSHSKRVESTPAGDDIALMLHTSGTTARPKLVPLTHSNLLASASAVASSMQLTEADRGLAVMPLFHIHGIVGMLLASLSVGAQIHVCGFDGLTMQRTISESGVTWISAVPTMYQAMLMRPSRQDVTRMRAARSSSAPLHCEIWTRLAERLDCPVVNSYGMTEAAHQMASTPVDGGEDFIGTVGRAAGPDLAVLETDGIVRPSGTGELVVRGAGLTAGYISPAGANDDAFVDGWFRTGDTGSIDSDGRIRLLGRIKELINVGGEKLSPFEVEEVLLAHQSVSEAVSFAMPSRLSGEEVHAAVTLSGAIDERELRAFARTCLAKFKTPTRIHIVAEIPKGATGKVQRTFLPRQLGLIPTEPAPSPDPKDVRPAT